MNPWEWWEWLVEVFSGGRASATVTTGPNPWYEEQAQEQGQIPPSLSDDKIRRARLFELSKLLSGQGRKATFLTGPSGPGPLQTTAPPLAIDRELGPLRQEWLKKPTLLGGGGV